MNHPVFRIVQDDTTRNSWLWHPELDNWKKADESEFAALKLLVHALREVDDPTEVLHQIAIISKGMGGNPPIDWESSKYDPYFIWPDELGPPPDEEKP